MVQLNKNLGNFNFKNTSLSAKTNATQNQKLDFKPKKESVNWGSLKDGRGRIMPGDTVNGKEVDEVQYYRRGDKMVMKVYYTDGSSDQTQY